MVEGDMEMHIRAREIEQYERSSGAHNGTINIAAVHYKRDLFGQRTRFRKYTRVPLSFNICSKDATLFAQQNSAVCKIISKA